MDCAPRSDARRVRGRRGGDPDHTGLGLRPGADLPHFDRLMCLTPKTLLSWASKIRAVVADAVAPQSAYLVRLFIVAGAIVTAFCLGWFCGWTSYSSRTAGAESSSEKRDVAITGSIGSNAPTPATLSSREASTSLVDSPKASLTSIQMNAQPPRAALATAQQATTSPGPSAAQSELKSEFGLGHLPATAALAPLSGALVVRAVVLNGTAGLVFGALYRRYGLEWAMTSHFGVDIVAHVAVGV